MGDRGVRLRVMGGWRDSTSRKATDSTGHGRTVTNMALAFEFFVRDSQRVEAPDSTRLWHGLWGLAGLADAPRHVRWLAWAHVGWAAALAWNLVWLFQSVGWVTGWNSVVAVLVGGMVAAASCVGIGPFVLLLYPDGGRGWWRGQVVEPAFHAHLCAVAVSLGGWPLGLLAEAIGVAPRYLGMRQAPLLVYAAALVVFSWGAWVTARSLRVSVRDLALRVPASAENAQRWRRLAGLRVAHLSDLHIGTHLTPKRAKRWLRRVMDRCPDIVVVTGDLVTSGVRFHQEIVELLSALTCRYGVYVVRGNHDVGQCHEELFRRLKESGVFVLDNENMTIKHGDTELVVAGVQDAASGGKGLSAALRGVGDRPAWLLSHYPTVFDWAAKRGVWLTLAGHTHGGQVALPWLYRWVNVNRLTQRYCAGVYRNGCSALVVSVGLGCTGLALRVGVRPEVVVWRIQVP